jgi:hypothetical protein
MVPQNHTTKVLILHAELCVSAMTEKAYISGQPKQLFEPLKNNGLFCCPANPFLDT